MGHVRPGGIETKRRRVSAGERQVARDERGDKAQLLRLERSGHGHCREAKRLRAKLENPQQTVGKSGPPAPAYLLDPVMDKIARPPREIPEWEKSKSFMGHGK
jgi:hypothetical protein